MTSCIIYFGRDLIASFFTNHPFVHEVLSNTLRLVCIVEFFSSCQIWQQGFLKALGRFHHGIYALLLSFYLIAMPMSVYLAFYWQRGIEGLWIGMLVGLVVVNGVFAWLAWGQYKWQDVVEEVEERRRKENQLEVERESKEIEMEK